MLLGALRIGSGSSEAVLQVLEMDPSNPYPEVLLSTFTGGAHGCNDTRVLTSSPDGRRFLDISHQPAMVPLHRRRLKQMEGWFKQPADQRTEANGFLAALVATKALVGDFDAGWRRMLGSYDRRSDWGLTSCEAGYDAKGNCRRPEKRYADFPAALRAFLDRTGYLAAPPT